MHFYCHRPQCSTLSPLVFVLATRLCIRDRVCVSSIERYYSCDPATVCVCVCGGVSSIHQLCTHTLTFVCTTARTQVARATAPPATVDRSTEHRTTTTAVRRYHRSRIDRADASVCVSVCIHITTPVRNRWRTFGRTCSMYTHTRTRIINHIFYLLSPQNV